MNERLKQLAEQAKLDNSCYVAGHGFLVNDNGMAKFAELIVKECIKAVDNSGGDNAEYHMDSIKKHFGEEE